MTLFENDNRVIFVDYVPEEVWEWIEENYNRDEYLIRPHMVRFVCAGPHVPLEKQQRQEGYEIHFSTEELAMAFKLRWGEYEKESESW